MKPQVKSTVGAISLEQLEAAIGALKAAYRFERPADAVLTAWFREHKSGSRDRAFIAELVYAVLRRKRFLERTVSRSYPEERAPKLRELVLVAVVQLQGLPPRLVEAALRRDEVTWLTGCLQQTPEPVETLSLGERLDIPDWLAERLSAQMPVEEMVTLMNGLNSPAPLDLRVNTLKADRDTVLPALLADGFTVAPCVYSPMGMRLKGKPALNKHPLFINGSFEVQDEGSQLLGLLLQPKRGEMVVDFCAGAGGKTLLLGAMMRSTGRLYALDVAAHRLAKLKPRAARAGLSNIHPIAIDSERDQRVKRLAGKADRVLVDAPCSGLGTLLRNPDLKWRQTAEGVDELIVKQRDILEAAAKLVRPGGRLVYATCSVLDAENAEIVDAFLATHPEFTRLSAGEILAAQNVNIECGVDLRLTPHQHGTDGFYAAVLERKAG
jgi:16S rRNA (cytosine967-C5)-methyltransferase